MPELNLSRTTVLSIHSTTFQQTVRRQLIPSDSETVGNSATLQLVEIEHIRSVKVSWWGLGWVVLQACKQYDSSSGRNSCVCRGVLVQDGSSSCDSFCEIHSQVGNHKGCSLKRPPVGLWAEEIADSECWGGNSTLTRRGQDRFRFTQADNKAVWSTIGWPGGWTRDSCDQDNLKLLAILWIFPLSEMDWAAFLISWWPWFLFQYFQCEAKKTVNLLKQKNPCPKWLFLPQGWQ